MKSTFFKIITTICLIYLPSLTMAQGSLQVTVKNINAIKGTIRVGLYTTEETFLKKEYTGKVVKVSADAVVVSFESLKEGKYGVSVIHDANDNAELDSNMMGIPKEGFAFGNNAMGMFGPAPFEKATVVIEKGKTAQQVINLKYL